MARTSEKALGYKKRAQGLSWEGLRLLWQQIQDDGSVTILQGDRSETMISLKVVVKGDADAILLDRLFSDLRNGSFQYYTGQGKNSLSSVGRSVLIHEGAPLLVVMDGETLSPRKADEERGMVWFLLQRCSAPDYCDAFVFVPGLEVIFFETPGILIGRFGPNTVTEAVIERGHYLPDDTLSKVVSPSTLSKEEFFKSLTSEELEGLRRGPQARKLIAEVERLLTSATRHESVALTSSP